MLLKIGMWQAAGIFSNAAVVGETRDRFYVRERRPAQHQPFGLEDAATRFAQRLGRDVLQHVGLLYAKTKRKIKKQSPVSHLPFRAFKCPPGSTGPGGLVLSTVYSAAPSVIVPTVQQVR